MGKSLKPPENLTAQVFRVMSAEQAKRKIHFLAFAAPVNNGYTNLITVE